MDMILAKRFFGILFFLCIGNVHALAPTSQPVHTSLPRVKPISTNGNIIVGSSIPLKKEGKVLMRGMGLVFRKINQKGGVNGRNITLMALDDKKSIGTSVKNIKSMLLQTTVVSNIFSTGVIDEFLSVLKANKFLAFAPEEGSEHLRKPEYKGLIHVKASIKEELEAVIDYAVNEKKKYTFAVFYEDSTLGRNGRDIAIEIIKRYASVNPNVKFLGDSLHPRGTVDVLPAVKKMTQLKPEAVVCVSRRHATFNFISESVNAGLFRTTFLGTSYLLAVQKLVEKTQGVKFIATSIVPDPRRSHLPIVNQYRKDMVEYYPSEDFSAISLGGFLSTSILVELIKRVSGPVTHEKIIAEAEKLQNFDLGGLKLSFDLQRRHLFNWLWISPGYEKKWIPVANNGGIT